MRLWVLLAMAALPACSRCSETPERPLTIGTMFEPTTLDPAFASTTPEREMSELLFRGLTLIDDRGRLQPSLAAALPEVSTATDGREVVRWRLREGYAWSDGHPITSADVVFGHRIECDPRLEAGNHMYAINARVQADGPHAFTVKWKRPYLEHAEPRVHAILPAHAYPEPKAGVFSGLARGEIASGPFRIAEWVAGQYLTLEKNPGWGGEGPYLDRIVFRFFKSEDGLIAALETGEVDAAGEASGLSLEASDLIGDRMRETHAVDMRPSGSWVHLTVKLDDPLLKDPRVRRAIAKAIDREALGDLLYSGHSSPAFGMFPEGHAGYAPAGELAYDPEAAKRLIEEAGANGAKLELMYPAGPGPGGARLAAFVAEALHRIGIELTITGVHFRVLSDKLRERTQSALTLYNWRIAPGWDGRSVLHSTGAQNYSGLSDPEIDRLLDQASASADRPAWDRAVAQVNLHFQSQLPAIPLLFKEVSSIRPRWLEGWQPTGWRTPVTWNAERWRKTRSEP